MTAEQVQLTPDQAIEAAWAAYLHRTHQLALAYEASIDKALASLGSHQHSAYVQYDAATQLAWDAWRSGTDMARQERDQAVADIIAQAEAGTDRAIAQIGGE